MEVKLSKEEIFSILSAIEDRIHIIEDFMIGDALQNADDRKEKAYYNRLYNKLMKMVAGEK